MNAPTESLIQNLMGELFYFISNLQRDINIIYVCILKRTKVIGGSTLRSALESYPQKCRNGDINSDPESIHDDNTVSDDTYTSGFLGSYTYVYGQAG